MQSKSSKIVSEYEPVRQGNQLLSRYRRAKVYINEDGMNYLESEERKIIPESVNDKLYTVEPDCEDRLDLVSYKFYGTPNLWWAIARLNNIKNPMRLEVGIILRIPPLEKVIV